MGKFIQIAAATSEGQQPLLYALDNSGDVWSFNFDERKWKNIPRIDSTKFSDAPEKLYRGSEIDIQTAKVKKKNKG